jgi:hypothetical protein
MRHAHALERQILARRRLDAASLRRLVAEERPTERRGNWINIDDELRNGIIQRAAKAAQPSHTSDRFVLVTLIRSGRASNATLGREHLHQEILDGCQRRAARAAAD